MIVQDIIMIVFVHVFAIKTHFYVICFSSNHCETFLYIYIPLCIYIIIYVNVCFQLDNSTKCYKPSRFIFVYQNYKTNVPFLWLECKQAPRTTGCSSLNKLSLIKRQINTPTNCFVLFCCRYSIKKKETRL